MIVKTDVISRGDGNGFLRYTTANSRLTSGVHLFKAPYIGMFIPWDESFDEALIKTITYTKFVIQLAMNIAFNTISFVLSWAYQYILSFIRSKLQS